MNKRHKTEKNSFLNWARHLHQNEFINKILYLEEKYHLRRNLLIFISILFISILTSMEFRLSSEFKQGDIAYEDIFSPFKFEVIDKGATANRKQKTKETVLPIFDYDQQVAHKLSQKIQKAFSIGKTELTKTNKINLSSIKEKLKVPLNLSLPDHLCKWLIKQKFNTKIKSTLIYILNQWLKTHVISLPLSFIPEHHQTFILKPLHETENNTKDLIKIKRDKVHYLEDMTDFKLPDHLIFKEQDKKILKELAKSLVVHNISLNNKEWIEQKNHAVKSVLPVIISVSKNQLIIRKGSSIREQDIQLMDEIKARKKSKLSLKSLIPKAILFFLLFILLLKYTHRTSNHPKPFYKKDITLALCILFIHILITKLLLYIWSQPSISSSEPLSFLKPIMIFMTPVALGPMLIGLLIRPLYLGWGFTVFSSIIISNMTEMNLEFFIFYLCSGLAAIYGVYDCKRRNDIYKAGIYTGLISGLVLFCILMISYPIDLKSFSHFMPTPLFFFLFPLIPLSLGLASGLLSSMLSTAFVPLLESLFQYITDIKLLELSNLNHPLLKQMLIKAPGTYHHSMMVGNMVETAAEDINAHALLGKVMSYYHDIGKMEYPNYFIENQKHGDNPHKHISPYMSKTILIAHVKDGAELAHKHKLGQAIIDGILQHHGTSLISFFYKKALETKDEHMNEVHREEFCYPGPKPQSKEAALCMLADTIEATARSMEKLNALKLKQLVKDTIQNKFIEKQLDECNLTLRDLVRVEKAFSRILPSIYHQRIETSKIQINPLEKKK